MIPYKMGLTPNSIKRVCVNKPLKHDNAINCQLDYFLK